MIQLLAAAMIQSKQPEIGPALHMISMQILICNQSGTQTLCKQSKVCSG